jgi:hypothetical protein
MFLMAVGVLDPKRPIYFSLPVHPKCEVRFTPVLMAQSGHRDSLIDWTCSMPFTCSRVPTGSRIAQ